MAKSWSPMVRTNCRMAVRLIPVKPRLPHTLPKQVPLTIPRIRHLPRPLVEDLRDESLSAVYFAAGRHHALDGWRPIGGLRGLSPVACFRFASSRLPHDSGADVLSRRQSRRHGLFGYRS